MPATPDTPAPEYALGDEVYIYIGVEDTGRGLTEDECKVLFQRFAQGQFSALGVHEVFENPNSENSITQNLQDLRRKWSWAVYQSRSF